MSEGRQRHDWGIASTLMALIANVQRDPKRSRALKPSEFDPFAAKAAAQKVPVTVLRDVFIDGRLPAEAL